MHDIIDRYIKMSRVIHINSQMNFINDSILVMDYNDFSDWLSNLLVEKDMSQAELSRRSGISPSQISKLINRQSPPGKTTCEAIAKAFGISVITVYRHAGILPPGPDDDVRFEDWKTILRQLPEDKREQLWKIAEIYLEDERKELTAAKLKPEPTTK
jgi:transcriptional regulator with XRE-family HTH domain